MAVKNQKVLWDQLINGGQRRGELRSSSTVECLV